MDAVPAVERRRGSYAALLAETACLAVLQVLAEAAEYRHNEHVIRGALEELGLAPSADALRAHLAWLEEQGLVAVECLAAPRGGGSELRIARLTERGSDVAAGRARVPGVARPRPGGAAGGE